MHVPSLVKMRWHLLKLSSENKNMGMSWADNSTKIWWNLAISIPKPDLHNINAHTKFGENPLMFTQVIIQKRNTDGRRDGWTTDWPTDRHTDIQCETIIPGHYRVAGYKKNIRTYIHSQPESTNILISSQKRAAMSENVPSVIQTCVCTVWAESSPHEGNF